MDSALWLGLGLIAGGSASLLFNETFKATIRNIIFGVTGSIIGGGIMTTWDHGRLPTLDFYSYSILFTALISFLTIFAFRVHYHILSRNFTPLQLDKKGNIEKSNTKLIEAKSPVMQST